MRLRIPSEMVSSHLCEPNKKLSVYSVYFIVYYFNKTTNRIKLLKKLFESKNRKLIHIHFFSFSFRFFRS